MTKRKAREDPDSSDDEIFHFGQAKLSKEAGKIVKKRTVRPREDGGPFHQHTWPTEAETRVSQDEHL